MAKFMIRARCLAQVCAATVYRGPSNSISSHLLPSFNSDNTSRRNMLTSGRVPIDDVRRRVLNRILYRSTQRGYLELDLILGKWAHDNITHLNEEQLQALVQLNEEENPDLWQWLTGQAEIPERLASNPVFDAVQQGVFKNLQAYSSAETRAKPGQPWVRGWDDQRKIGGLQVGNQ